MSEQHLLSYQIYIPDLFMCPKSFGNNFLAMKADICFLKHLPNLWMFTFLVEFKLLPFCIKLCYNFSQLCEIDSQSCKIDFQLCKIVSQLCKIDFQLCKIDFQLCKIDS